MKFLIFLFNTLYVVSAFISQGPNTFVTKSGTKLCASSYLGSLGGQSGAENRFSPDVNLSEKSRGVSNLSYSGSTNPTKSAPIKDAAEVFDTAPTVVVQGNTLRTCSFDSAVDRVQIALRTEGRPLTANVELWQGPDNTPQKVSVYLEDGAERPFCSIIETPSGTNSIAIRNTGMMEFPLTACIDVQEGGEEIVESPAQSLINNSPPRTVQGGAVYTSPFSPGVASVQVVLRTDGRPLNARVELLQGPNNNKQVMELYSEDGKLRPFFAVLETPGSGNVVRIVNTATIEYPLSAHVEPFMIDSGYDDQGAPLGAGGVVWSD